MIESKLRQLLTGHFRADGSLTRLIRGALRDTINIHGSITTQQDAESAVRRIVSQIKGAVLHNSEAEFVCYHVTTKDRLASILVEGLRPNSEPNWFQSETPYVMLSLYPYWRLYEDAVLLEIKDPEIKREFFDDPEGLRWGKVIEPKFIHTVIDFKINQEWISKIEGVTE